MTKEGEKEIRENVKLILKILNGNGNFGICAKVNTIWWVGSVFMTVATAAIILLFRKILL